MPNICAFVKGNLLKFSELFLRIFAPSREVNSRPSERSDAGYGSREDAKARRGVGWFWQCCRNLVGRQGLIGVAFPRF
jgi:hypothetical protein